MPETDDPVRAHIAADHAVRQPRLEWLIDDAPLGGEIAFAAAHEVAEDDILRQTAAACVQYPDDRILPRRCGDELDLPHSLSAVAAILLEHARARRLEPGGKLIVEFPHRAVEMGVGAPAKMLRAVKHLLDAHLEDHVGMGADPDFPGRDLP